HLLHGKDPRLLPVYEADNLLRRSQPEAAIPLIESYIMSLDRSCDLFYLQRGYTMLLRANLELRDIRGTKGVLEGMKAQDVAPDIFFIRMITKKLRGLGLSDVERKQLRALKDMAKDMMNEKHQQTAAKAFEWVKVIKKHAKGQTENKEKLRDEKRV